MNVLSSEESIALNQRVEKLEEEIYDMRLIVLSNVTRTQELSLFLCVLSLAYICNLNMYIYHMYF